MRNITVVDSSCRGHPRCLTIRRISAFASIFSATLLDDVSGGECYYVLYAWTTRHWCAKIRSVDPRFALSQITEINSLSRGFRQELCRGSGVVPQEPFVSERRIVVQEVFDTSGKPVFECRRLARGVRLLLLVAARGRSPPVGSESRRSAAECDSRSPPSPS